MSLATRCPSCGTIFRVVQDQLKVSEGWVRCGQCHEVFHGIEALFDLESDPAIAARRAARTVPAAPPPARVFAQTRSFTPPAGHDGEGQPTMEAPADEGARAFAEAQQDDPPGHGRSAFAPAADATDSPSDHPSSPIASPPPAARGMAPRFAARLAEESARAQAHARPAPSPIPSPYPEGLLSPAAIPFTGLDHAQDGWEVRQPPAEEFASPAAAASDLATQGPDQDGTPAEPFAAPTARQPRTISAPQEEPADTVGDDPARAFEAQAHWQAHVQAHPDLDTDPGSDTGRGQGHDWDSTSETSTASAPASSPPPFEATASRPVGMLPEPLPPPASMFARASADDRDEEDDDERAGPPTLASMLPEDAGEWPPRPKKRPVRAAPSTALVAVRPDDPRFLREAHRGARWSRPGVRVLLGLALAVLVAAAAGQLAWPQREALAARWPATQPAWSWLCAQAGCTIQAPRSIASLSLDGSSLTRTDVEHVLLFSADLHNRADHAVRMPAFDLTFMDLNGEVVARKVLAPEQIGIRQAALAPDAELRVHARIQVGSLDASGFQAEMFYP